MGGKENYCSFYGNENKSGIWGETMNMVGNCQVQMVLIRLAEDD